MGLFGGIGKALKGVGRVVGGVAKKAAPIAGLIPGVGTIPAALLGAGGSLISGDSLGEALRSGASGALGGLAGKAFGLGGGGGLGGALDFLKKNPELIAAGVGAIGAAKDQSKSRNLADEAVGLNRDEFAAGAPLRENARTVALQGIPGAPDLSSIFAQSGNPFFRPLRPIGGPT